MEEIVKITVRNSLFRKEFYKKPERNGGKKTSVKNISKKIIQRRKGEELKEGRKIVMQTVHGSEVT